MRILSPIANQANDIYLSRVGCFADYMLPYPVVSCVMGLCKIGENLSVPQHDGIVHQPLWVVYDTASPAKKGKKIPQSKQIALIAVFQQAVKNWRIAILVF